MIDLGKVRYIISQPEHEGSFSASEAVSGQFQINLFGSRQDYLKLAELIRSFAETPSDKDEEFHQHHYALPSLDGKSTVEVILRKDDVGTATWRMLLQDTPSI
jgi:hypothetical protein